MVSIRSYVMENFFNTVFGGRRYTDSSKGNFQVPILSGKVTDSSPLPVSLLCSGARIGGGGKQGEGKRAGDPKKDKAQPSRS